MDDFDKAAEAPLGIDFVRLAADRAALGLVDDGRESDEAMDDPAFSRLVLGLR